MPTRVSTGLTPKSFAGGCILAVFGLAWSAGVLSFDVVALQRHLSPQIAAIRYATAPGRMISSEVKVTHSSRKSERDAFSPKIRFSYEFFENLRGWI